MEKESFVMMLENLLARVKKESPHSFRYQNFNDKDQEEFDWLYPKSGIGPIPRESHIIHISWNAREV